MTSYIPFQLLRTGFNKNTKLLVADTKKLPDDLSYLRGKAVKFIRCIGNTVNVFDTYNVKKYIPIQFLLAFEDKTVQTNPSLFDTTFVVHSKNDYGYHIGAVFETTVISCGRDLIYYNEKNQRIILHSSWVYALNAPAKPSQIEDLVGKFNSKPPKEIPLVVAKASPVTVQPTVNKVVEQSNSISKSVFDFVSEDVKRFEMFKEPVEDILSLQGDYYDISGHVHKTLLQCLKANQYLLDLAFTSTVTLVIDNLIQEKDHD